MEDTENSASFLGGFVAWKISFPSFSAFKGGVRENRVSRCVFYSPWIAVTRSSVLTVMTMKLIMKMMGTHDEDDDDDDDDDADADDDDDDEEEEEEEEDGDSR